MKRLVTFALALVCSMGSVLLAQEKSPYVVTLEHEGQLQTFYGPTGFQEAYNAASDGDVITLPPLNYENWETDSEGWRTIRKAITIRGTRNKGGQTSIGGASTRFELPQTTAGSINVEGVVFSSYLGINTERINITKCKITYIVGFGANASIINCELSALRIQETAPTILNSVIGELYTDGGLTGSAIFVNCNFNKINSAGIMPNLTFLNCIVTNSDNTFPSTVLAQNCVYYSWNFFEAIPDNDGQLNNKLLNPDTFFIPNSFWKLTEEAQATYLGEDGTEVGIYGGQYPWNDTLITPTITNLNVSKRVAQGETLKIDVEAE